MLDTFNHALIFASEQIYSSICACRLKGMDAGGDCLFRWLCLYFSYEDAAHLEKLCSMGGGNPAIIEREKICDHGGERDIEMIHMIKRVIPRHAWASPCHQSN